MSNKSDAMKFLEGLGGGPLTFGRLIRSIRLGEGQSLDTFAKQLGISRTNLSDIEHGRRGVSIERVAAWAKLLGYEQAQFVELAVQAQIDEIGLELRAKVMSNRPASGVRPVSAAAKRAKVA
jgi:transcriptional regulator with XRE-family HTH domain